MSDTAAAAAVAAPASAPLLRRLHRASAVVIALFVAAHIANHLAALRGVPAHVEMMRQLRLVYRAPLVEPLLLAAVAWQMVSGLLLVLRSGPEPRRGIARLQAVSGIALLLFLGFHVGAVLAGRGLGLETDFHFAAAGFHFGAYWLFFAPYYFAAVTLLFTHLGCAASWRLGPRAGRRLVAAATAAGATVGALIVAALAEAFHSFDISPAYGTMFGY